MSHVEKTFGRNPLNKKINVSICDIITIISFTMKKNTHKNHFMLWAINEFAYIYDKKR